jgi:two-component system, chemotaxis family, protein-glutamate methylesterase/glutaminase
MPSKTGFVIIIGASAGGMRAIAQLLRLFPTDMPAAIGVVIHLPRDSDPGVFQSRLQKSTVWPCEVAADHMVLEDGHIYLAPAGFHMLIREEEIVLGEGPAEGRWKPSIDATLRSAAATWDSHCVGIILTGMLDDGTVGMEAVQRCGGHTLVQDPEEADYPEMPLSVIEQVKVDGCLPLRSIPGAVEDYLRSAPRRMTAPEDILLENKISERVATKIDDLPALGDRSLFSCPECGGGLWEIREGHICRYRCHIGHTFTEKELLEAQETMTEKTLWVALRTMEEKRKLLEKIARREKQQGMQTLASEYRDRSLEMNKHIERLKAIIFEQQRLAGVTQREG